MWRYEVAKVNYEEDSRPFEMTFISGEITLRCWLGKLDIFHNDVHVVEISGVEYNWLFYDSGIELKIRVGEVEIATIEVYYDEIEKIDVKKIFAWMLNIR